MSPKRLRLILLGCLAFGALLFVVIAAAGLSILGSKSQKTVSMKLQSKVLDYQLTSLTQAKKQVQQYSYIKNVAQEVIPNDKDQAQAVLEISQLANDSGIAIQSISFPSSTLGTATSNAATASTTSLISQSTPVTGISGLYSVQLIIVPQTGPQVPASKQVTYAKTLDFLDRIERNQRTAQITQVSIQPQSSDGSSTAITFSLTINIFIRP